MHSKTSWYTQRPMFHIGHWVGATGRMLLACAACLVHAHSLLGLLQHRLVLALGVSLLAGRAHGVAGSILSLLSAVCK